MNRMEKEQAAKKATGGETAFSAAINMPVVVTTEHRGVFFGYLSKEEKDEHGNVTVTLANARNCIMWTQDVHGFMGLASGGPTSGCRIGPQVNSIKLMKVTAVIETSNDAALAWERAPWGR